MADKMPGKKSLDGIAALETYMRSHFHPFERRKPTIDTQEFANDLRSALERARVFLKYPDNELYRDPVMRQHTFEILARFYEFEFAGPNNL